MDEHYYSLSLKYLALRPRSEKEIADYLKKKKVTEKHIHEILNKLREQKFVNDDEFAKWWIEQRTRFKVLSKRFIEIELRNKGISQKIIEELRSKSEGLRGKSEKELIIDIIQKRIHKYYGLPRHEIYQKLGGFLSRRGFEFDAIKACIDEVLEK